ncbi:hypothetical protein RchiOBHm_Chr4g0438181 [Rosa chinensis]|uniref:Uncharacterized protein n=1 Tax=Rosa chinensis TaxID=74649 RepID=A0A2P6R2H1_ROSCH|nr:hypothetical protein RchiOBHm_Chr4g0438181 [Rosa chinensis]
MGRPILCFPDLQPFGPPLQEEPTTATPNHPASDRKRAIQTSRRELFTSESNIKAKRDTYQSLYLCRQPNRSPKEEACCLDM